MARFQWTTSRKWCVENRMVTWVIESQDCVLVEVCSLRAFFLVIHWREKACSSVAARRQKFGQIKWRHSFVCFLWFCAASCSLTVCHKHTLCSEKNTHSRFLLYLRGKCLDLHKIFRVCLWGIKYSADIRNLIFFATGDVILTPYLHVCKEYVSRNHGRW